MQNDAAAALDRLDPTTRHALTYALGAARDEYAAAGDAPLAAVFAAFMSLAHQSTLDTSASWAEVRACFSLPPALRPAVSDPAATLDPGTQDDGSETHTGAPHAPDDGQ